MHAPELHCISKWFTDLADMLSGMGKATGLCKGKGAALRWPSSGAGSAVMLALHGSAGACTGEGGGGGVSDVATRCAWMLAPKTDKRNPVPVNPTKNIQSRMPAIFRMFILNNDLGLFV